MAPYLPAMVLTPEGGEFAKDAHGLLEASLGNLLSGNMRSSETGFARLEAVGLCPCTLKLDLKN